MEVLFLSGSEGDGVVGCSGPQDAHSGLVKAYEVIRTTEPDFGVETAHSSRASYIT